MTKYVLSRECLLMTMSSRFYVVKWPGIKWEVDIQAIKVLSFFTVQHSLRDILSLESANKARLLSFIKYCCDAEILVDASCHRAAPLLRMSLVKAYDRYSIYSDGIILVDEWSEYFSIMNHILNQIEYTFEIRLKDFNVCFVEDNELFRYYGGGSIPRWASCYVYQDCIVQKTKWEYRKQSTSGRSSYNMRGTSHEIGHVVVYKHCKHLPNWLSEGICEYMANTLYPVDEVNKIDCHDVYADISYFINNPREMLISHNSNRSHENELYFKAGIFVKNILRGRKLKSLMTVLACYDFSMPIYKYLVANDFAYSENGQP